MLPGIFCMLHTNIISMYLNDRAGRRFAETMLFWRGHLRVSEVGDFLGVCERTARSRMQAWRDRGALSRYRQNARKRLVPPSDFDPGPVVTDVTRTLSLLLTAKDAPGNPFFRMGLPEADGGNDLLVSGRLPRGPIQQLLAAYLDREPARVFYVAKSGRQEFVFSPSALVRARGRFHLRGFRADGRDAARARLADRYVDVVLARAVEVLRAEEEEFVGLDGDRDWRELAEEAFVLSRRLTDDERVCYEHQYGIADEGELRVRRPRALMPYVRQELAERRCWRADGISVPIWTLPGNAG